jgi:putative peptide zinc metalloprotease protein
LIEVEMRRKFYAPLLVVATLAFTAAPALADNSAIAINTKDDSTKYSISFKIERTMSSVVNPINSAIAYASCSNCQTVAIAIDVVFAMGSSNVVTNTNQAYAINYECTQCSTLADAYQFLTTTGGPVHLTASGNQQIAEIRRQLEALRHENLNIFQINQQVTQLMTQLQTVLSTQVVPAGKPAATDSPGESSPTPSDSPSPAESPSGSPSPASSPSPSPSAS